MRTGNQQIFSAWQPAHGIARMIAPKKEGKRPVTLRFSDDLAGKIAPSQLRMCSGLTGRNRQRGVEQKYTLRGKMRQIAIFR